MKTLELVEVKDAAVICLRLSGWNRERAKTIARNSVLDSEYPLVSEWIDKFPLEQMYGAKNGD